MKRRITLAGVGLAVALAAIPAIALAQTPDRNPATAAAECPLHAEHAALHGQLHGATGATMHGGGMSGHTGMAGSAGMDDHTGMHGQMDSMARTGE